jgi:hypothetical protein
MMSWLYLRPWRNSSNSSSFSNKTKRFGLTIVINIKVLIDFIFMGSYSLILSKSRSIKTYDYKLNFVIRFFISILWYIAKLRERMVIWKFQIIWEWTQTNITLFIFFILCSDWFLHFHFFTRKTILTFEEIIIRGESFS